MSLPHLPQPMGLRDLLDETFDLYKEHFVLLVSATAHFTLPIFIVGFLLGSAPLPGGSSSDPSAGGLIVLYWLVLGMIALFVALGHVATPLSRSILGPSATLLPENPPPLSRRVGPFLKTLALTLIALLLFVGVLALALSVLIGMVIGITSLMVGVASVVLGEVAAVVFLLFIIILGSLLSFIFVFVMPVFTLEGLSGFHALKRGLRLYFVRPVHNGIGLFLVALLLTFAYASVLGVLGVLAYTSHDTSDSGGGDAAMLAVVGIFFGMIQSVLLPAFATATLLLYFDARIRTEGLDLHFLASELEHGPVDSAEETPEVVWPRPAGLEALTLLMGLFNLTTFVFDFTEPKRFGGTSDLVGQIIFVAFGYVALWFFRQGHNVARLLVMLGSIIAIMEVTTLHEKLTWPHKADIVIEALVGAFLLIWLNAKPVAGYFLQKK